MAATVATDPPPLGTGNRTLDTRGRSIDLAWPNLDDRVMTPHTGSDVWQADRAMTKPRPVPRLLTELVRRRTWAEGLYALLGLPIGIAGFVFTVVTLAVSGGLLVTFIGLPLMAASGLASRQIGLGLRRLANRLIGANIAPPQPFRAERGLLGWIGSCLKDGTAWRSRVYLVLKFPLGIAGFIVALVFWLYGLGGVTYAAWRPFLGCNTTSDGKCHRAIGFTDSWQADTPFRIVLTSLAGAVLLLAAPWAVRGVVYLDQLAIRWLLGPSARALTPREREVLQRMAEGMSNAGIAAELVISDRAVEKHVANIFMKFGMPPAEGENRRVLAVLRYLQS
jgi:hypothetical protein